MFARHSPRFVRRLDFLAVLAEIKFVDDLRIDGSFSAMREVVAAAFLTVCFIRIDSLIIIILVGGARREPP
jgi:hypothetical protein